MSAASPAAQAAAEPEHRPAAISRDVLADRTARVRSWLAESGYAGLVAYGGPAAMGSRTGSAGYLRYFTGWMTTGLPAVLVLPADGRPTVITMGPHDTRAFEMQASWYADIVRAGSIARYPSELGDALHGAGIGSGERIATLGFGEIPASLSAPIAGILSDLRPSDAEPAIDAMRLVRHPQEVQMHRIGAGISDAMIETAMQRATEPGITGARLMADIEHAGRELGAGTPSTWLATGVKPVTTYMEQMEVPGPIEPGDRVQLGTSLSYQGYFAQGLRISVLGKPSPALEKYAQILLDIQDAALAAMRPGAPLHLVSDAIESAIDAACPYDKDTDPFRFQSCHGLGLSYAEPGMARDLNVRRDKSLDPDGVLMRANMVIEVHPNFTAPEVGHVCAGDMALITEAGAEWLTRFPRGLVRL
jgi:Xaa-Pro aminopeptidase